MNKSQKGWIVGMSVLVAIYLASAVIALTGHPSHILVKIGLILLVAHVLELPLAMYRLKGRGIHPLRLLLLTVLFGLVWWVPAQRGWFVGDAAAARL